MHSGLIYVALSDLYHYNQAKNIQNISEGQFLSLQQVEFRSDKTPTSICDQAALATDMIQMAYLALDYNSALLGLYSST